VANKDLELKIKATDEASGPIGRLATRINKLTEPGQKLTKEFGRLGSALNVKGFAAAGGAFKNVLGEVGALVTKFAALGAGAGFAAFTMLRGAVEAGDKLGEMAQRVGLTVDAYASLSFAAAQADVDQEAFNGAMDQFNKRLGEAKAGGGGLLSFLKQVSPKLAEQVKHAKSTEAGLALMTDAMARIEDPGKRAALAAAAFGKSGLQMGVFLHQGSKAIQEQQLRYMQLSGSQEEFARLSGDLDNTLRESEVAFLGVRNAVATGLFPAFGQLAIAATDFISKNRDGITRWANEAGAAISRWIDGGGIQRLADGFGKLVEFGGKVVDFLGPMGLAITAGAVAFGPLIASVISLGAALAPLMATFGPFLLAAAGIAAAGFEIYKNWDDLIFIFKDWGNSLKWAVLDAWEAVRPIFDKLGGVFDFFKGAFRTGATLLGFGESARPTLGAEGARPAAQTTVTQTEAKVSVDFNNLPRGTRVTQASSSQPVDLSLGYSMAGAQ